MNVCDIIKGTISDRISILILVIGIRSLCYRYLEILIASEIESKAYFTLNGPHNISEQINATYNQGPNDTSYNRLMNITDFKFKLNPNPCKGYQAGLLLVVIISSRPNNSQARISIRNTWGQSSDFAKVVFLLGESSDNATSRDVERESWLYGDIVQGSFVDSYRNMTYKHLMGLKWVVHHCGAARYVLKADDDVVVNSRELWRFLVRELSPWGAFIIYSQDVVQLLLETTQNLKFFWIDDVQITGIAAARVQLCPTEMASYFMDWQRLGVLIRKGVKSVGKFLLCPLDLEYRHIYFMWNLIQ